MTNTYQIIDSYKTFLKANNPFRYASYINLLKQNIESAKSEAVMFSIMKPIFHEVNIFENMSSGGPDFICNSNTNSFVLEVTHLESKSVASQSGINITTPVDGSVNSISMITHMLRKKISSKADQISNYSMPRILAITCEHYLSDSFLGVIGAESLLTSDSKICFSSNKQIDETSLSTDLKNSIFIRLKNGILESCRRSISAILLINLSDAYKSSIVGILHYDPIYSFSTNMLPTVPFLRIKKWPPINKYIELEWSIDIPIAADFIHREIY